MSPQHDYVIDNSTGANVRSDINSVLQAISSNNSGSSAPSTTYALQSFANTTDSMLQLRNAANNAFVNLRKFDGALPLPDGSVSSPSLFFDDDTNTGIYSSAADTFNVATGGVERMELGATTIFNEGGADVDFRIEGDTNANLFYVDAGNDRIGIGTSSPSCKLQVNAGSGGDGTVTFLELNHGGNDTNDAVKLNFARGGGDIGSISLKKVSSNNTTDFIFNTRSGNTVSESMRITGAGNIGLGTTSPSSFNANADDIVISRSGNAGITIDTPNSNTGRIAFGDPEDNNVGQIRYSHSNNALIFDVNVDERLRIDSSGHLLFGGTSEEITLQTSDGSDNGYLNLSGGGACSQNRGAQVVMNGNERSGGLGGVLQLLAGNSGSTSVIQFYTSGSEVARIGSNGLVSINSTSALINESGLSVKSSGNTCVLKAEGAAGHLPLICWNNHGSGTRSQIQFGDGTSFSAHGQITTNGANVTYGGTSDYRKKQDDVLITDGIEKIKLLKPKRFKWKDALDLGLCDGFFAHEVQETAPTAKAVIGVKDEVDSDNNPVYQQIDQSKLVPLLVAAVQELIGKVEALETA